MEQPLKRIPGSFSEFNLKQIIRSLAIIIPLAIAGNIIYILLTSKPHILRDIVDIHPGYLLLAALLALVPWFAHTTRIILWSRAFKKGLKPIQAFKTAVVTDLGSGITPSSTGGGYFKLAFLIGYGFTPGEATLLTFLGSIEDAIFFAVTLPIAVIISRAWKDPYVKVAVKNLISHWPIVAAAAVILTIAYFIFIRKNIGRRFKADAPDSERPHLIERMRAGIHKYQNQFLSALGFVVKRGKATLGVCTFLSGLGWCCRYGAVSALVVGLGFHANFVLLFLLQWVVFTTMTLIPTPGAVGGAEVTFALVFSGVVPSAILPILIGAWRFVTFYMLIALGAIFMAVTGAGPSISRLNGKNQKVLEEVKA
jgi:glycosyltransferase 2 family protein